MDDVSFEINLIAQSPSKVVYRVKGAVRETSLPVQLAYSDILEMECPLNALGMKTGEKINIWFSLKIKDMLVDRLPKRIHLCKDTIQKALKWRCGTSSPQHEDV
ncbi:MAG: hypothetical protein MZV70_09105 [Desulfobacterales bacterium]|nr:hypothetical protein [Desulfobacterales bacterium]